MTEDTKQMTYETMDDTSKKKFKYWQNRTIIGLMVGYALFYFVRKNLSIAMPYMEQDLGISKTELGVFLTAHGLVYGISRFANGIIADRANARLFMALGLVLCAICNIIFGFSTAVIVLGVVWVFNGWFQGMGFPPCVHLMTHWIPPHELATKMSVWNTSHSIGAGLIVVLCGFLMKWGFGWEACFFVPSAIALAGAAFLLFCLRDTPSSVGLPELGESGEKTKPSKGIWETMKEKVFNNKYIWLVAIANFFVYVIRFGIFDWGPTMLKEWKGVEIHLAGIMMFGFEAAGVLGMLLAGWATDKFFGSKGIRVCMICMIMATLSVFLLGEIDQPSIPLATALLMSAGFFIYGPQALIGIISANLATKEAAGAASGFTGIWGYLSTAASGVGLGYLAQHYGWDLAFQILVGVGIIGSIIFLLGWKAKAHGYEEN